MEVELFALLLTLDGQLAEQSIAVNTDAHRREFKGAFQNGVPDEDVAVEACAAVLAYGRPVIVVGRPTVVLLSIGQLSAYADDKYRSPLLAYRVLALLGCLRGVHLQQLFAVYEVYLLWQERLELWIGLAS